ncbi:carbamoyl-phosphate synthase (glutamine-hydrolyzing) large subunit [Candidatus Microgenomates bacterium]|nr:carbamoyl-phosphate synthase (glutamine-hydrolyzing) large subunit [Candidatus Microgenomates bacterium]
MQKINKVLILGSGALKIGEAGEFDYSGSQAIKALKEEGIRTVLVNPNIATIQTSKFLTDTVYFLPVNDFFVEKVIEKEKPDGIFLAFGGQTALNCGIQLHKRRVLKKHNIAILGSPMSAILLTEDRNKFARHLERVGLPIPKSGSAKTINQALKIAQKIGFPVMVRAGFALGGQGSGVAKNARSLKSILNKAFSFVPQVLIEQYLHHYREFEYEIVRDLHGNCITVCNMENMDPMGIHTGESIVVAPSQTLNNFEYHSLRSAAIKIVNSLKIVGECNVQFAVNPSSAEPFKYYVIEVNARLSRSSALASKATGYPLAYVAAKLALGQNLTTIKNKVTGVTQSCFEPALDYIVVKIPRWDMDKFRGAKEQIGSSMKSVGEVMGIGRTFEEAYQKTIRMLDLDLEGPTDEKMLKNGKNVDHDVNKELTKPTPKRMFGIAQALKRGFSIEKIHELTGIDPWFLSRIENIVLQEAKVKKTSSLDCEKLLKLKRLGFSDKRIGELLGTTGLNVRALRKKFNLRPFIFQIDTLAAEFPARTNYLYCTYNAIHNDVVPTGKEAVIVLGSGPYRIGSSVEFDWTTVNTALSLKNENKKSIMINCNPETVSTDYDISDRLYFEELTFERIADIYEFENPLGVIVSVGGQTPNNRAQALKKSGFNVLGTDPSDIDRAEDRSKFSKLLDDLGIKQPAWDKFSSRAAAADFCEHVGYPVLIRPSYVLSGNAMRICHNRQELNHYTKRALIVSQEYPITISKFIEDAKEIEFDAVAEKGKIKTMIISEHVENAGIHSGDATIVLPPQKIYLETQRKIQDVGRKIAKTLSISGPFNIQFLAKDNEILVIEINLRSSRTFPFIAKVSGIDLMGLAVKAFFGRNGPEINGNGGPHFVAVKVPQFSFARLAGADPILNVEMSSTGEAACFGDDIQEAFLKAEISVGGKIPKKGIFVSLGGEENKIKFLKSSRLLSKINLPIFATEKTAQFLNKKGVEAKKLYKIHEKKSPNILQFFQRGKVDLVINVVDHHFIKELDDDYAIRRWAVDYNIPLFTDLKKAELFVKALSEKRLEDLIIKPWSDYR